MTITDSQKWLLLTVLLITGLLVYLLGSVLTPFLIAALFAYLGDPVVDRLEDKGLSRTISVVIVFIVMTLVSSLVLLVIIPLISAQISALIKIIPQYAQWIATVAQPWVIENLGLEIGDFDINSLAQAMQGHWGQAGGIATNIMGFVGRSGGMLLATIANLVLIPVVTFYLLRDWDRLIAAIHHILPRAIEPDVANLAKQSDEMLSAFLRGQILVMLSLSIIYSVGLWIAGVKFALLIGLIAGIVSFVPYMGLIVGILIAGVAVILQTHDPSQLIWVALVFSVGQLLEGVLLTPYLVGDRIGLHPVAVIFSVMAGGQLFGFIGILIALPVAAVLAVFVRDLHARYMESHLYYASDNRMVENDVPASDLDSQQDVIANAEGTEDQNKPG